MACGSRGLCKKIPQLIGQLEGWQLKEIEQYIPHHATADVWIKQKTETRRDQLQKRSTSSVERQFRNKFNEAQGMTEFFWDWLGRWMKGLRMKQLVALVMRRNYEDQTCLQQFGRFWKHIQMYSRQNLPKGVTTGKDGSWIQNRFGGRNSIHPSTTL